MLPDVFGNPTHHSYFDLFRLATVPVEGSTDLAGAARSYPFWGVKNYVEGTAYVGLLPPQVLRGKIGLVTPDRDLLLKRCDRVSKSLAGTKFAFKEKNGYVETTCPWGNTIRMHDPVENMELGMAYVEFDVPAGTAKGIADFYAETFDALTSVKDGAAHIAAGQNQELIFRETAGALPAYDGHHIQVYVANFSKPHDRLVERGLLTEESNRYQYRFQDIVDPKSGKKLFEIEHEIRSMTHPMFARPLLNRNPVQTNRTYVPGRDGFTPAAIAEDMPGRPGRQRMG